MKVSREQMAENRLAILQAAGQLFRKNGFEGVSVVEVMNAAGFTHGGFYGHFSSKDDLIAETLAHLLDPSPSRGVGSLGAQSPTPLASSSYPTSRLSPSSPTRAPTLSRGPS